MKTKNNLSELKRISKGAMSRESYKKINSLKSKDEKEQALKYSIISYLEKEYHQIKNELSLIDSEESKLISLRLNTFPSKLKHFKIDYKEEDFYKLKDILNKIKREMKNAKPI